MGEQHDDTTGGTIPSTSGLSRRRFLTLSGVSGALTFAQLQMPGGLLKELAARITAATPSYQRVLWRREDQLTLFLDFYNLERDFGRPQLVKADPNVAANYLVVRLAPQNLAEQAFTLSAGSGFKDEFGNTDPPTDLPSAPPVRAILAGESRLAFIVPDDALPLPLDSAALLDWARFRLHVVPHALSTDPQLVLKAKPTEPTPTHTAIEMPWRLQLSPHRDSGWAHSITPVAAPDGRTELWHTRLGVRTPVDADPGFVVDEHDDEHRTVRAIWALDPDFRRRLRNDNEPPLDEDPFQMALYERDRYDIVRLSSDFSLLDRPVHQFSPQAASVEKLILSPLGGWLDSDAHWDLAHVQGGAYNSSLLQWRHKSAMLRDEYVRVVRKGYLFPFGHKASLIRVVERRFSHIRDNSSRARGAYLRQRIFIVVGKPVKNYATSAFVPKGGRKFPFRRLEAITMITPDLDDQNVYASGFTAQEVFQPEVDGAPFRFHFIGTDWAGDEIDVRAPVVWVDDTKAYGPTTSTIRETFRAQDIDVNLQGQRVSLATPKAAGDTQVVLASVVLGALDAEPPGDPPPTDDEFGQLLADGNQPRFFPSVQTLTVSMSEAEAVAGSGIDPPVLEYDATYLDHEFSASANKGGVFLARPDNQATSKVGFSTDKSGGSFTPNLFVDGLSRELGPVSGDLSLMRAGRFDPASVFTSVDAKLLGGVHLSDILRTVDFGGDGEDANVHALQLQSVRRSGPDRLITILDWHPDIYAGGPFGVFEPNQGSPQADSLDLHATIVSYLDPADQAKSTFSVLGEIRNFTLNLFGNDADQFVRIPFNRLTFRGEKDKKTDVDVDVGDVEFVGALHFVQELTEYIGFGGGSGLAITTSGDAIRVQLTLALPRLAVGVFALENLAISAGCAIPYNGDPVRFEFAFCSRENPFHLIIMMFGGGGFVGLWIGIDGVEMLEFSFEFGAAISIDVGVASGSVELMGGVYFQTESVHGPDGTYQQMEFSAYVELYGEVSALGIVTVSLQLYLSMTYEGPNPEKLTGEASMTVEVEVLFFSGSVTISVKKEFVNDSAGAMGLMMPKAAHRSAAAPFAPAALPATTVTFGDVLTQMDWNQYCDSFAAVGA